MCFVQIQPVGAIFKIKQKPSKEQMEQGTDKPKIDISSKIGESNIEFTSTVEMKH